MILHATQICLLCQLPAPERHGLCPTCFEHLPWRGLIGQPSTLTTQAITQPEVHLWSWVDYVDEIPYWIKRLKYHQCLNSARSIGALMSLSPPPIEPNSLIIPVPSHPSKRAKRGYNQAEELAKHLANHLSLPWRQPCERVVKGRAQSGLTRQARAENAQKLFRCHQPQDLNRPIIFVDDVITTGFTLASLVAALPQGCHSSISCWCFASTPGPGDEPHGEA